MIRRFASRAAPNQFHRTTLPPPLFLMGRPGCGKGTQSVLLTREFGDPEILSQIPAFADPVHIAPSVLSCIPIPSASASASASASDDFPLQFRLFHLSVGAILRHAAVSSPAIESLLAGGKIVPGEISVALIEQAMALIRDRVEKSSRDADSLIRPIFLIDGFPRSLENIQQFQKSATFSFHPRFHLIKLNCSAATSTARILTRIQENPTAMRSDDNPAVIARRLSVFDSESSPALSSLDSSAEFFTVDGEPSIPIVYQNIRNCFIKFANQFK